MLQLAQPSSPAALLMRLKGIGAEFATVLYLEGLFRRFDNRRQLAAYAGLTPSPWKSGVTSNAFRLGLHGLEAFIRSSPIRAGPDLISHGKDPAAQEPKVRMTLSWRGIVWTPSAGQERFWLWRLSCRLQVCVRPVRAVQWPLALMDCPPPEAPIWISRLMRMPSHRVCLGRRSD